MPKPHLPEAPEDSEWHFTLCREVQELSTRAVKKTTHTKSNTNGGGERTDHTVHAFTRNRICSLLFCSLLSKMKSGKNSKSERRQYNFNITHSSEQTRFRCTSCPSHQTPSLCQACPQYNLTNHTYAGSQPACQSTLTTQG
uniref:Uncharacterized protein n=1 Tax=Anguilla anguilla TaxID=7936 RepID=A0A0E9WYZ3_ANGAN